MRMVVSPLEWRLISRLHLLRRKHAEKEAKEFLIYVLGMAGLSLLPLRPRVLKCLDWVRVSTPLIRHGLFNPMNMARFIVCLLKLGLGTRWKNRHARDG
jgi:hypothetical protein